MMADWYDDLLGVSRLAGSSLPLHCFVVPYFHSIVDHRANPAAASAKAVTKRLFIGPRLVTR
jgi:hypothetical protein